MQEYEHIPVHVEAIELNDENAEQVAEWCGGRVVREETLDGDMSLAVNFPTIDGNKRLSSGQVLVRSKTGQFMAHNKGFFETMFQPKKQVRPPVLPHAHIPGARRI